MAHRTINGQFAGCGSPEESPHGVLLYSYLCFDAIDGSDGCGFGLLRWLRALCLLVLQVQMSVMRQEILRPLPVLRSAVQGTP